MHVTVSLCGVKPGIGLHRTNVVDLEALMYVMNVCVCVRARMCVCVCMHACECVCACMHARVCWVRPVHRPQI